MADLPKIGSETKRKRALSDDELALAWHAVEEIGWAMGTAVQVLIQTGARRLEIAALRRDEIDWIRREIRLEGDRTIAVQRRICGQNDAQYRQPLPGLLVSIFCKPIGLITVLPMYNRSTKILNRPPHVSKGF
jgi:integrase